MGAEWQPLSVRTGKREPDGPYEGVPAHLHGPLANWLDDRLHELDSSGDRTLNQFAAALRIPLNRTNIARGQILNAVEADESLFLDAIDLVLRLISYNYPRSEGLTGVLYAGGSIWTVSDNEQSLERRVPEATRNAFSRAASPGDVASDELTTAWRSVFGIHPDPSDAWDHSIKAVESVLIPIVVPNKTKATLADVAGELKMSPDRWRLGLDANRGLSGGALLEGLIRHIWVNPDRHGPVTRKPTQEEAEVAVQIAVTIVGICRDHLSKIER